MELKLEIVLFGAMLLLLAAGVYYIAFSLFYEEKEDKKGLRYGFVALLFVTNLFIRLHYGDVFFVLLPEILFFYGLAEILFVWRKKKPNILKVIVLILFTELLIRKGLEGAFFLLAGEKFNALAKENVSYELLLLLLERWITVLGLFFYAKKKSLKRIEIRKTKRNLLLFFLISLINVGFSYMKEAHIDISSPYLLPAAFIGMNLFMFYMLLDMQKMSETMRLQEINEMRQTEELKLWREMDKKEETQKKMLHDYSETLFLVRTYLKEGRIEELKDYVDRLSVDFKFSLSIVNTGNSLFDALIHHKYEEALASKVNLILKLDNLSEIKIASEDFVILMSNLINNAREHCEKLETKKKEVFVSVENRKENDILEIMIRNPIEKEIKVENNLIHTSKDGELHGFGLKNIRDIIEKYHGEGYIYTDDGYFTFLIKV